MGAAQPNPNGTGIADPGKRARSASGIPVVPVFDGYRAFAISGVLLLHLLILSQVVTTGDESFIARVTWGTVGHAVDVLFVVSGFVVFLPTVARGGTFGSVGAYAIRRAARLMPAYWLVLVIIWALIALTSIDPDVANPDWRDLGLHFTGLQVPGSIFISDLVPGFGINPPVWTLSAEIGFYVVLPLIAAIWFRHPFAGLALAAAVTLVWNWSFENLAKIDSWTDLGLSNAELFRLSINSTLQFPSWAFSFGLGMTGAWAYLRYRDAAATPQGRRIVGRLLLVALTGFILFAWLAGRYSGDIDVNLVAQFSRMSPEIALGYSGFLALLMVAIALGPTLLQRPFANRRVRWLGDISYGIYLSHMVFAVYLGSLLSLPNDGTIGALLIWTVAVVPASVLYGYLSARFLEQPVRQWARKFGRRGGPENDPG